jgi:hydroxypyruvate isomerase
MVKFSVCIEMFFREYDYPERIAKVAAMTEAPAVEFWGTANKDLTAIGKAAKTHGLTIAAFSASQQPIVDMSTHGAFVADIKQAVQLASDLGCPGCLKTVGQALDGVDRTVQHNAIVEALTAAAPVLEAANLKLYVEPLNVLVNHKGYYLDTSNEGFEILREVGSPNVLLLYDIYHQQITEGNIIATIEQNIDLIGHFHLADVPGRHEPGTGELNYANIFKRIDALDYHGYVGMEFTPTIDHAEAICRTMDLISTA